MQPFENMAEPRFKEDRKLMETQLLGPDSYYATEPFQSTQLESTMVSNISFKHHVKPSAAFKSGVKRTF